MLDRVGPPLHTIQPVSGRLLLNPIVVLIGGRKLPDAFLQFLKTLGREGALANAAQHESRRGRAVHAIVAASGAVALLIQTAQVLERLAVRLTIEGPAAA